MNKKYIAINTHLILCIALFCVFVFCAVAFATENEIGFCIAFSLLLLLPVFVAVISPLYYVFSEDCLEIVYNFGIREQIKWTKIKNISLMGRWFGQFGPPPHYAISYTGKEKRPFFVAGQVAKTGKTKKLMKRYYKREIV